MMLAKEACYLTIEGKLLMLELIQKGIDADLALEILHLLVPNDKLYDLEGSDDASN